MWVRMKINVSKVESELDLSIQRDWKNWLSLLTAKEMSGEILKKHLLYFYK